MPILNEADIHLQEGRVDEHQVLCSGAQGMEAESFEDAAAHARVTADFARAID